MANNVPTINITSDKEEDDDHHILIMADVLTDVEDLEETSDNRRKPKTKLIIKVSDDLGGNTDTEDIEASDAEETPVIVRHKNRVSIANFMETGSVEETCNIIDKTEKTNFRLFSQKNLTPLMEENTRKFSTDSILTDVENVSGSDADSFSDIPDIDVNTELYEFKNDVNTKDSIKYSPVKTPSPCVTPLLYLSENESSNKARKTTKISGTRLSISMHQFPNITDVEMLTDDEKREHERKTKKIKKRRSKNKFVSKNAEADSDVEYPMHTSEIFLNPYDRKGNLENAGTTDVEEFEADSKFTSEYVYDPTAMNREIEKMQCFYESTKEQHSCKNQRERVSKNYCPLSDESDNCNKRNVKLGKYRKESKWTRDTKHYIQVPKCNDVCLTDDESIYSSEDENDHKELLKPRSKCVSGDVTEEETVLEANDYLDNLPVIKLPSAKREIMCIKENDSGTPTVVIGPLEETVTGLWITEDEATDTESILDNESNYEGDEDIGGAINDNPVTEFDEIDTGTIEEREFTKPKKQALLTPIIKMDPLTDTEEIAMETDTRNKNVRTTLRAENHEKFGVTDTEDIYFSDIEKCDSKIKSKRKKKAHFAGDKEKGGFGNNKSCFTTKKAPVSNNYFDSNDDQSYSVTPNNLYKELEDAMSKQRLKNINKIEYDSSDDVMYLKGGSYEIPSDTDNVSDINEGKSKVVTKLYARNYKNNMHPSQILATRIGNATNFNIDYKPLSLNSLSMLYVNYAYTLTIPYTEKSIYHFGTSEIKQPSKPVPSSLRRTSKKLTENIARLVTKFESFNSNRDPQEVLQKNDDDKEIILNIKTNFNVNNVTVGNSCFVKRVANAGWSAPEGQSKDKPTEAVAKQGAATQETSSVPLTKTATTELTTETKLTPIVPKPKPRVTKPPDTHIQLTTNIDKSEFTSAKSPVRDDTLDVDDAETTPDTYSDKKKFWENVTKDTKQDNSTKKRYSLYEETSTEQIHVSKRTSIHEVPVEPPVPKPRIALQSSQSISETKEDVPMRFDERIEAEFAKPLSEYQSAFIDHSTKTTSKQSEKEELTKSTSEKSDSSESDHDQSKSTGYENTGYISDSGDVEHYISDSEIEDRVPQIRERQMSVFHTPATTTRKNIYERSMSLPTEDLYDLKNILQKKQYYEEQIRKEMVEDELMTELEEEASPERKALGVPTIPEEEPPGARSVPEKETPDANAVKDIAKSFGETIKTSTKFDSKLPDKTKVRIEPIEKPIIDERKSVKDLAKSFETDSGSLIIGQKVLSSKQKSEEKKEQVIEKDKIEPVRETEKAVQKPLVDQKHIEKGDLTKYMEESVDESTTDITMQDFETSEELGSKEIDEISIKKLTKQADSTSNDLSKDEVTETLTTDSILLISEKDLRTSDIQEGSKADYKEDIFESDEKSEESKITYASDIDRDSLVTKDIIDMLKKEDHAETLSEEKEPSLTEKHALKDIELEADLSEIDQKSDASRITYASDIEKDIYKEDSHKFDEAEEIKEKEISSIDYDKHSSKTESASPLLDMDNISHKVESLDRTYKPSEDLLEDTSINRSDVDSISTSIAHKPELDGKTFDETHKLDMSSTHKAEDQMTVSQISETPKTHKETDSGPQIQSSTESEQSVFSDHSLELGNANYKEDLTSKPSDSMEVHVDKSEIEDSEKIAELEQDATDVETKSLDSLNATEMSPKTSFYTEDNIPEITISLSGKQRRISEESEESEEKPLKKGPQRKVIGKSESGSPIYQPEEHVQDTVWEVSVESQEQPVFYERASDLPVARRAAGEKDDELSCSLHEESDLGSEIHQDHSESASSSRLPSDSHSEIEKLILESLHQQKISHEDAKVIASELLADIEAEIQKRHSIPTDTHEPPLAGVENEVSEYLKELAEAKGLDSREVQLVQSVLARKQRELGKLSRNDTQASSMEITDEDLKYSGAEVDFSPSGSRTHILEEQIEHLEVERIVERKLSRELGLSIGDTFILGKPDEFQQTYDDDDDKYEHKTEIDTKLTEKIKSEKEKSETISRVDTTTKTTIDEKEKTQKTTESSVKELDKIKGDKYASSKEATADIQEDEKVTSDIKITISETIEDNFEKQESHSDEKQGKEWKTTGKYDSEEKTFQETDDGKIDQTVKTSQDYQEERKEDTEAKTDRFEETKVTDNVESTFSETSTHKKVSSSSVIVDSSHTESKTISSTVITDVSPEDFENLKKSLSGDSIPDTKSKSVTSFTQEIKRTSSDDSKSSQDEIRSPEEQISTSSSDKKVSDAKVEVVMRKPRTRDTDTSSSSPVFKGDRKSGVDFEAYSSSGESHYQSFELDSGRSRPCSSDVEGLIAAGSSEYESALTSQDISAPTHHTSYHTAVSSLSSKESMKSLDSESSGNLASVEVSEASETLVASEYDAGDVTGQTLDDFSVDRLPKRQSTELSDSELLFPDMQESIDVSEEDGDIKIPDDMPSKMKRSYEMTFQPEPKVLVPESPHSEVVQEMDERFGTSLDEGSVLSVSLSSTSSATALRTVIELSHAELERPESSLVISGTSDLLSCDDLGSKESLIPTHTQSVTESSTSTINHLQDTKIGSVTITTSTIAENGIQCVSTQVTSQSQSPELDQVDDLKFKEEPFDPKKRGHRRCESTISSNIMSSISTDIEKKLHSDLSESDKYISIKEGKSDEKKDVDETEKDDFYLTEADQGFQGDTEYDLNGKENDVFDFSRPQSQVSKSDSKRERITSTAFSDDRPDSELAELLKQCSSSEAVSDPIERPVTPEPCEPCDEYEIKDDTPEFSSEAQASVGELEQEYSSAVARSQEISEIKKQILAEVATEKHSHKDIFDKRDSHGKLSSTSSEKSSFEEAEAEAVFSMVAHVSPAHKIKQICPILEDEDAEKHELETRERAQKEYEKKRSQHRDQSPGSIPDIKVTQHMAPLVDRGFLYPDLELEKKEEKEEETQKSSTPQTPASSKSSESTDQGREYNLEDPCFTVPEEPEDTDELEEKDENEEKPLTESKSEVATVVEKTMTESEKDLASPTDSPNSDSFEMLEKPDLIDDFVVIEEVGKEASEMDMEGKSVKISSKKYVRRHDQEVEEYLVKSAPSPSTKMTDIKYYPDGSSSEELGFDFEESPPQPGDKSAATTGKSPRDYVYEYDKELEANRKWIEQQFQGNQAAMIAAGYGYEMEFERGPLEDIKEEDINDFDSSRIGSLSSQKESGGSLGGSVKDSYSSTPEYDVLAGRKYFTRSGDHDDISMSSLQEFENLERAMSLENRRCIAGSQDSSSNGSFKNRFYAGRSGQGDDVSVSSLKEFEGLEIACIAVHKIEVKVKEEEAMLAQIDEGQESIASESESCETISGTDKKLIPDSDDEDYEKRMFEIDEIIKQAQSNVERFIEVEKTESLGRGDSFEEVAKVPDLDLDTPIARTTTKVQWSQPEDVMATSTDSLDLKVDKPSHHDSTDSLDQKTTAGDVMTASTDSIEFQAQKSKEVITSDSIEIRDGDRSYMITSDSLEMVTGSHPNVITSDSIDEDGSRIGGHDQSSSSTGKDFSSSVKEDVGEIAEAKVPSEYMLDSTDSIASTSMATHATYQYETDSVYSGSFTSGGSNTMVSSTETIEPSQFRDGTDTTEAIKKSWFDEHQYLKEGVQPYVTEIIEPCDDDEDGMYSHTVHRQVQLPPEISKVTFTGPDAEEQMKKFMEKFDNVVEECETEEIDEYGNKHIKRIVQKRFVIMDEKSDRPQQQQSDDTVTSQITRTVTDDQGTRTTYTQQFDPRQIQRIAPRTGESSGESYGAQQQPEQQTTPQTLTRAQGSRRRPLRYEISIDDQTEVDPREHDWRFNLPQHAEAEESSSERQTSEQDRPVADQHMLSDEMKRLLKELEEESKK